jgi:ABC-type amino acid transport substrate-binding protein
MRKLKLSVAIGLGALLIPMVAAAAQDSLLDEIRDRGSIRTCHAEAFPWNAVNPETNEWEGTDVEAAKHLAETLGVEHELVPSTWGTLIPSLEAGTCDIVMANLFRTPERAVRVLFSEPYGFETKTIVASDASGVSSYEELDADGKTVLVVSGSADESFGNRFFENAEVRAMVTDKIATLLVDVASGRADALLVDSSTARKLVSENAAAPVSIIEEANPLDPQGFSYAIPRGEYHFLNFVNVWQEAVEQQGLRDQWAGMFTD